MVLSFTAPAIRESSLWFLWAKVGQSHVLLFNHKVDTHLPSLRRWKDEST